MNNTKKTINAKQVLLLLFGTLFLIGALLFVSKHTNTVKLTDGYSIGTDKVSLVGEPLKVGDTLKTDYKLDEPVETIDTQKLTDLPGKGTIRIFETVPSLDTPVCSMQTAELNMLAPNYDDVTFIIISQDLPFAQKRYCGAKGVDNVSVLSDYRTKEFSTDNGLLINENKLNARTIFVVDKNDKVTYVEYAKDQTQALDLQKALDSIEE